jgi:hypothetical protein
MELSSLACAEYRSGAEQQTFWEIKPTCHGRHRDTVFQQRLLSTTEVYDFSFRDYSFLIIHIGVEWLDADVDGDGRERFGSDGHAPQSRTQASAHDHANIVAEDRENSLRLDVA